jgi:hypothetical protein
MDEPGRPTLYQKEFAEQAYKLCLMGAVNADLARAFEVAPRTIDNWLRNEPVFRSAVAQGRQFADGDVAHGLYRRATGYTYYSSKPFLSDGEPITVPYEVHCPPDVRAAIFWLRNRQPARWRDGPKPAQDSETDDRRNWWPGAEELERADNATTGHPTTGHPTTGQPKSEAGPPDAPKATPAA